MLMQNSTLDGEFEIQSNENDRKLTEDYLIKHLIAILRIWNSFFFLN